MKSSAIIREARGTITPIAAWTRWAFARDKSGKPALYTSDDAVAWCAVGAMLRAKHFGNSRADAVYWLNKSVSGIFSYWQDHEERTHDEVLDAMDRAATLAEAEGD